MIVKPPEKCVNVSFPRSGHHALCAVLSEYFGDSFKYHDVYAQGPQPSLEESNYTKAHDLDLQSEFHPTLRQIIQTRNPIDAVQSWMDYDRRVAPGSQNEPRSYWERVFAERIQFWAKWYEKWVLSFSPYRIIVPYERLVADPVAVCLSVIQFMTSDHANPKKLADALAAYPIKPQRARYPQWIDIV